MGGFSELTFPVLLSAIVKLIVEFLVHNPELCGTRSSWIREEKFAAPKPRLGDRESNRGRGLRVAAVTNIGRSNACVVVARSRTVFRGC
jgi:hypothetical protein